MPVTVRLTSEQAQRYIYVPSAPAGGGSPETDSAAGNAGDALGAGQRAVGLARIGARGADLVGSAANNAAGVGAGTAELGAVGVDPTTALNLSGASPTGIAGQVAPWLNVGARALSAGAGALTLARGGNDDIPGQEGWQARGAGQIISSVLPFPLNLFGGAASIGHSIFSAPGNARWMRNIREQAGNIRTAGQSFSALEDAAREGRGTGDWRTALSRDVGGMRAGDLALGIAEGNLRGDYGPSLSYEPDANYSGLAAFLREHGFTPGTYDRGGVHGNAAFIGNLGTFDPHSSVAQGEHGVSRLRSLIDPYAENVTRTNPGISARGPQPISREAFTDRYTDTVMPTMGDTGAQGIADAVDEMENSRSAATTRGAGWLRETGLRRFGALPPAFRTTMDRTAGGE